MKYCPRCGAERIIEAPFCYECGSKFEEMASKTENKIKVSKDKSKPEWRLKKTKKNKKGRQSKIKAETLEPEISKDNQIIDDGYDGYYDDIVPVDTEEIKQPLDKELIKRIAVLMLGAAFVIGICIFVICYV